MREQLAPFPAPLAVNETCQRVMVFLVDASVSTQDHGACEAGEVAVEALLSPPGSVVADYGLVVVAQHGSVCDLLDWLGEGWGDV